MDLNDCLIVLVGVVKLNELELRGQIRWGGSW